MITALRRSRGFTLIELMIVVTIIGILSSVALPNFTHMMLRARTSERQVMMSSISKAFEDLGSRTPFSASVRTAWNPPLAPGGGRRLWSTVAAGWNNVPLVVQGACYYSYQVWSYPAPGSSQQFYVYAYGDLDADGAYSQKIFGYVSAAADTPFVQNYEDPPPGLEDDHSPQATF